jgi:hypothetical protein
MSDHHGGQVVDLTARTNAADGGSVRIEVWDWVRMPKAQLDQPFIGVVSKIFEADGTWMAEVTVAYREFCNYPLGDLEPLRPTQTVLDAELVTEVTGDQVLDVRLGANQAEAKTVRQYLAAVLASFWAGTDLIPPMGNALWRDDVYAGLVTAGLVDGSVNADGYVESFDRETAQGLVALAFEELARRRAPSSPDSTPELEA